MGVRPPGIKAAYDDMNVMDQAMLISYDQLRQIEEDKRSVQLAQAGVRF
jgi:hypothetical protein